MADSSIQLSKQENDADSLQCPSIHLVFKCSVYVSPCVMQGLKQSCGQPLM